MTENGTPPQGQPPQGQPPQGWGPPQSGPPPQGWSPAPGYPPAYGPPPTSGRNKTPWIIGAIAVLVVGGGLGLYFGLSGGDDKSADSAGAKTTVDQFYAALNSHDTNALSSISCSSSGSPLGSLQSALASVHDAAPKSDPEVSGSSAASQGTMTIGVAGAPTTTVPLSVQLERKSSSWCVSAVSAAAPESPGSGGPAVGGGKATAIPVTPVTTPTTAAPSPTAPASPTAYNPTACHALENNASVNKLIQYPNSGLDMPDEFVIPATGTNTAVCMASFYPTDGGDEGHIAYVAEYTGVSKAGYVAQLTAAGWKSKHVAKAGQAGVYAYGGDTVYVVASGSTLIMLLDTGH